MNGFRRAGNFVRRETVPDDIHGMFVAWDPHRDRRHCRRRRRPVMGKPSIVGAGGWPSTSRRGSSASTARPKEGDCLA
jgi:hypothetical protein